MLYALWCLEDLERADALLDDLDANERAFDMNHAMGGSRRLQQKRDAILRRLHTSVHGPSGGMSLDELRTFPGMPDYKKPVS